MVVDIWAAAFTARRFSIAEVSIKASAMEGSETRSRFFSGGFWRTSYIYEIGVCPYEY
jgi:hypothetical protein